MRSRAIWIIAFAALATCARIAPADTTLRFPQQGYYRISHYLPVEVSTDLAGPVTIRADGVMPTVLVGPGRAVIPVLVLSAPSTAASREWLVNGQRVHTESAPRAVALDEPMPVEEDASYPWADRVDDATTSVIAPNAYGAIAGWQPGQPPALRRRVVLFAVLASILVVGTGLLRRRWCGVLLIPALCGGIACGIAMWRASHPTIWTTTRTTPDGAEWTYFTAPVAVDAEHAWQPVTRPIFASLDHVERVRPALHVDASGAPVRFTFH
ncbi:MAG: hypothetical protein ACREIT_03525, partial [Tepidisphaeraceae bacterium]